jgi:hypothetical protein
MSQRPPIRIGVRFRPCCVPPRCVFTRRTVRLDYGRSFSIKRSFSRLNGFINVTSCSAKPS